MVPAAVQAQAPGLGQAELRGQRVPDHDFAAGLRPDQRGEADQQAEAGDHGDVQRIDPRQPRPEEGAEAETALAEAGEIDVREDEAGQDEEQLDAQVALGDQRRRRRARQIGPIVIAHHPNGGGEAQGGQRLQIFGRCAHRMIRFETLAHRDASAAPDSRARRQGGGSPIGFSGAGIPRRTWGRRYRPA